MFIPQKLMLRLPVMFPLVFIGCESSKDTGGASMDQMAAAVSAQKAAAQQQKQPEAADAKANEQQSASRGAADQGQRKKFGDRPVEQTGTYFGAIIGARRHILNEADNWPWKKAMGNFKGTNGRKPKDTKEFMKMLKENDTELPRLEPSQEYQYDPNVQTDGDFGQLYVVEKQPASQNAPPPGKSPVPK